MQRTINSTKNLLTGVGAEALKILLDFATRTVFIYTLGAAYLGINGLFSNVLMLFSLLGLDFAGAIVYNLYRPIEMGNRQRILQYMDMYKTIYRRLGVLVALVGLALIPFLPAVIKDYGRLETLGVNAALVFLLYLLQNVSYYLFFAHKASIIHAHQKGYILINAESIAAILTNVVLIAVLVLVQNFILYTVILMLSFIARNMVTVRIANNMYPYIREKPQQRLSKEDLRQLGKDSGALFLFKLENVVITATDNVVLSVCLGLETVGVYSNYLMIVSTFKAFLDRFHQGIAASLGSMHVAGDVEMERFVFRVVNLLTFFMYGLASIGIAVLADEFIRLWIGQSFVVQSWTYGGRVVKTPLSLLIAIEVYLFGVQAMLSRFRNAMGLFQQAKFRPVAGMLINLVVSCLLAPVIGVAGVVVGTIVALLGTNLVVDPLLICRRGLQQPARGFFWQNLLYVLYVAAAGLLCSLACSLLGGDGWLWFFVKGAVCVALTGLLFLLVSFRCEEFRHLLRTARELLHIRGKK